LIIEVPSCFFINGRLLHYEVMYHLCVSRLFEGIEGMSIFEGQSHYGEFEVEGLSFFEGVWG
jgi:hypothetical protein